MATIKLPNEIDTEPSNAAISTVQCELHRDFSAHVNENADERLRDPNTINVLFGPQSAFTSESILQLRRSLRDTPALHFISKAIVELPQLWPAILEAHPGFDLLPAKTRLRALTNFFSADGHPDDALFCEPLPSNNLILSPLTVVLQFVDFWKLTIGSNSNYDSQLPKLYSQLSRISNVQGFCIGFLTALCISSSRNEDQLKLLVTRTMHLAMLIGAWVDLEALKQEGSARPSSIAVRWKSMAHWEKLTSALNACPEAYISCVRGPKMATIVVPEQHFATFMANLDQVQIQALRLPLQGSWHCRHNLSGMRLLSDFCSRDERFQLLDADALNTKVLSNIDGQPIQRGPLQVAALQSILVEQSRWDLVFDNWVRENGTDPYLMIGEKVTIPRVILDDSVGLTSNPIPSVPDAALPETPSLENKAFPESAIAIIGMACRYPDADSVEAFWDLINAGKCVIRRFPEERFRPSDLNREPPGPFWGGYVRDIDAFDHQFFGISGREAKSMDPQQRIALEVAYEAMESAGYCGLRSEIFDRDIGCYVGIASDDYDCNVASHPVNAFSLTGTLRCFVAGRISHFFGWTGPSITVDTACSSGAVAIHTACRALQVKDCSVAMAGGVGAITSSRMTQNLAGASFLSPTGASKAFDTEANGYVRAEGVGMVVLRPLKEALLHQNHILGVMTGSAVNQNPNTSPMVVPDTQSQRELYQRVLSESGTLPTEITYVEAHGTGTQVGDPVEFKGIRDTFGTTGRTNDLYVGSVKDNIGHTEASSGVASLMKTVLMMQKGIIPKLANFRTLNPKIAPLGNDHVLIPTNSIAWNPAQRRKAVINNYGASGNNAALILHEFDNPPLSSSSTLAWSHYPIYISGKTPHAVRAYCRSLEAFLVKNKDLELADVAFNLATKQNRAFEHFVTFSTSHKKELLGELEKVASSDVSDQMSTKSDRTTTPAVVLCFGGQEGRAIQLSKQLYDGSPLLQHHLAECERICTTQLGRSSVLFPAIFGSHEILALATFHCALFSIQYACAKSWLDVGLKPDKLIGHSFGQLTALCVAGSLSLSDALKLIICRTRLLEDRCAPPNNGAMLVVTGTLSDIESLLQVASQQTQESLCVECACYNGPESYVLAGDEKSIQAVEATVATSPEALNLKFKRLENSHAFHSRLLDNIMPEFLRIAEEMHFMPPSIPIEACSRSDPSSWNENICAAVVARHTREPVYFMDAIARIETQFPERPVLWLEAGSGSSIIPMVRRAAVDLNQQHVYVSTQLQQDTNAQQNIVKATSHLWSHGLRVQFWQFHESQTSTFQCINLPPYQFEKTRHWLDYKPKTAVWKTASTGSYQSSSGSNKALVTPLHFANNEREGLQYFEINPENEIYRLGTAGHGVAGQNICPASMYVEFALLAARFAAAPDTTFIPHVSDLTMSSPLVLRPRGRVFLKLETVEKWSSWNFSIFSHCEQDIDPQDKELIVAHGTGRILTKQVVNNGDYLASSMTDALRSLQNLILRRCHEIENCSESIGYKNSAVYRALGPVVTYVDYYHGIQSIYNIGNEAVAHISLPKARKFKMGDGLCDPVLIDNFTQMAGVFANVFGRIKQNEDEISVCNFIGRIGLTNEFIQHARDDKHTWTAYGKYEMSASKRLNCDIFIFEPATGNIVVTIESVTFQKVSVKSLSRVLRRMNDAKGEKTAALEIPSSHKEATDTTTVDKLRLLYEKSTTLAAKDKSTPTNVATGSPKAFGTSPVPASKLERKELRSLELKPCAKITGSGGSSLSSPPIEETTLMLQEILQIPLEHILPSSLLADLGIDSLLGMEVFAEIKKRFGRSVTMWELACVSDVQGLASLIARK